MNLLYVYLHKKKGSVNLNDVDKKDNDNFEHDLNSVSKKPISKSFPSLDEATIKNNEKENKENKEKEKSENKGMKKLMKFISISKNKDDNISKSLSQSPKSTLNEEFFEEDDIEKQIETFKKLPKVELNSGIEESFSCYNCCKPYFKKQRNLQKNQISFLNSTQPCLLFNDCRIEIVKKKKSKTKEVGNTWFNTRFLNFDKEETIKLGDNKEIKVKTSKVIFEKSEIDDIASDKHNKKFKKELTVEVECELIKEFSKDCFNDVGPNSYPRYISPISFKTENSTNILNNNNNNILNNDEKKEFGLSEEDKKFIEKIISDNTIVENGEEKKESDSETPEKIPSVDNDVEELKK